MKYYVSGTKRNPGSKDIGAFYGMNRTAKINDFQLSEMENIDCEFFPYAGTRRDRVEISDNMAVIASDSDVNTSKYEVTGITKNGKFIYRGKDLGTIDGLGASDGTSSAGENMELMGGVSVSGDVYLTEYNGEYVLFPDMKAISVTASGDMNVTNFKNAGDDYETNMKDYSPETYEDAGKVTCNESGLGSIVIRTGNRRRSKCSPIAAEFIGLIVDGRLYAGASMVLSMYYHEIKDHYAQIPEGYYEVISYIAVTANDRETLLYFAGTNEDFTTKNPVCSDASEIIGTSETSEEFVIEIGFTAYDESGAVVNIAEYFDAAMDPYNNKEEYASFQIGSWKTSYPYDDPKYSNLKISFIQNAMAMGEPYGGRLFALDVQGVTVYYSSAAKKYDFTQEDVSGGAGFLLCSEPGKWTGVHVYQDSLYVFKRNGMWRIYSTDGLTYYMDKVADVGAICPNGVSVVDNVLYFISDDGIYRFTGAYPQLLPDSLGRRYDGGSIGGDDGKVFLSLTYGDKSELCVWHADKEIFSRHDGEAGIGQFLYAYGGVYGLDKSGNVYRMEGERGSVAFSMDTKKYFFGFSKKGANGAQVYFDLGEGSFEILVSYDGGEFESCGVITDGRVRYVPIRFRKCDELQLRICGEGIFTLRGISFSVYQGGNVKQNHMIKW